MGSKGKASLGLLILIIITIVSLGLVAGSFYSLQKEREEKIGLQQQLEDLKSKESKARAKVEESQRLISGLESQLKEAAVKADGFTQDLEKEKATSKDALSQVDQLNAQLEQQKKSNSDLESAIAQSQDKLAKLQADLGDLQSKKTALEARIKELEQAQKVELGQIVVNPDGSTQQPAEQAAAAGEPQDKPAASASPVLEGKVLVVNKEYNFVVTSLGSKDGIKIGDMFSIYRGNDYIGDVKIEKIHDSMSAAGFVSADTKDKVKEGDKLVQRI
jgi:hypothetical protein